MTRLGNAKYTLPKETVAKLLERFVALGFLDLKDSYSMLVTDCPTTYVTLSVGGVRKRVRNYWVGSRDAVAYPENVDIDMHEKLDALAQAIDAAANTRPLVGSEEERRKAHEEARSNAGVKPK